MAVVSQDRFYCIPAAVKPIHPPTEADQQEISSFIIPEHTISRTLLAVARSQYIHTAVQQRNIDPKDHLVLNACTIRICLPSRHIRKPETLKSGE